MLNPKLNIALCFLYIFIFSTALFSQNDSTKKVENGIGTGNTQQTNSNTEVSSGVMILSKARPNYTDVARTNGIEGIVRLRVIFLATGEIGSISPVAALPYGLTEQAYAAARQIKFTPATKNGVPVSVAKLVEYHFSLYYGENDMELKENAALIETPAPEHPSGNDFGKIGGKVKLTIALNSDGRIQIIKVFTDLPKEFEQSAIEAASKIKFKPAVHKNGNIVTQTKEIEYEFKAQKN